MAKAASSGPAMSLGFKFLTSPALRTVAVLEVSTDANAVRVGFDRRQLEALAWAAMVAADKLEPL
jgi:hypothetical protein